MEAGDADKTNDDDDSWEKISEGEEDESFSLDVN